MDPNPYQSPSEPLETTIPANDRALRNGLATEIRRFLTEEVTAFEFDELLDEYCDTEDSAVRFVTNEVWFHYDDCHDHLVALNKPNWDYLQRLLLLLASDRMVETTTSRRWSWSQLLAGFAIVTYGVLAYCLSLNGDWLMWLVAAVPFGLVSIVIARLRYVASPKGPFDPILFPFTTFSDLKSTYVSSAFRKTRFPRHIQQRRAAGPFRNLVCQLQFYALWLLLAPIPLAFQVFPQTETQVRVISA